MKKFVGLVNGKSFDNVEDWKNAANEAIKNNDETLSISSYYSYSDNEEEEKESKDKNYLPAGEYILVSQEPETKDKGYVFPVSDELSKKIHNASNKDDIRDNVQNLIETYTDEIINSEKEMKELETKIEKLQSDLYDKDEKVKKLYAYKEYYENISNSLPEHVKETSPEKEVKKSITSDDVKRIFGSTSIYDALRQLGLFV